VNGKYIVADARELPEITDADIAQVDFAWARPQRNGVYATYPTYDASVLWDHVDAVYESLNKGGWAFFDADDWLLPRLINYIRETWGDVAATYSGGGYRRTGTVVYDGHPGGGHYYTNGGYHVVFAHKGETDRTASQSSKVVSDRPNVDIEWGTIKPVKPYKLWIDAVARDGDTVIIPHAGTAPGAIAAEELGLDWVAIDSEEDAREAFFNRVEQRDTTTGLDDFGGASA